MARTIAALAESDDVQPEHIAEALAVPRTTRAGGVSFLRRDELPPLLRAIHDPPAGAPGLTPGEPAELEIAGLVAEGDGIYRALA